MQIFKSNSYDETILIAESFAKTLKKGAVIAFIGNLGMGKTAFTVGLCKGFGIQADVSSPTFAICNTYVGNDCTLHHFDMYRVENYDDLYSTGYFDYLETDACLAIEWSENIYGALPDDTIIVEIEKTGDNERIFKIYNKNEEI